MLKLEDQIDWFSVPKSWQTEYPHIFSTGQASSAGVEATHTITAVHPVVLSEIIFSALSDDAYAAASSDPSMLEEWFLDGDVVLREGATYTHSRDGPLTYKLIMASPVQQGIAKRGSTKVYVSAHPASGEDGEVPEVDAIPDMVLDEADSGSESDKGDFEIGEDFLAGSVLRSFGHSSSSPSINGHLTNGELASTPEVGSSSHLHLSDVEWTCRAYPLQTPCSFLEDECAVYVRTSDLSRIGVLDGDWVGNAAPSMHAVLILSRLLCDPGPVATIV